MGNRAGERCTGPKCVAIVGPFGSGKTTLLDAILEKTGAIAKQGAVATKNTVGDHSPEAREHQMSVEATVANTEFMGESLTFIDCPGSVEFATEGSMRFLEPIWLWWSPRLMIARSPRCS